MSTRFKATFCEEDGGWLDVRHEIDSAPCSVSTTVHPLAAKTIITRNQSPDLQFDQSINAYVGCEQPLYDFAAPIFAKGRLAKCPLFVLTTHSKRGPQQQHRQYEDGASRKVSDCRPQAAVEPVEKELTGENRQANFT